MRRLVPLCLLLALPLDAEAKDLREKFGVGFNNQFSQVSSLSLKYGLPADDPAINIQVELNAGLEMIDGAADGFFLGGRGLYGVVAEDNMNLYVAGGVGFLSDSDVNYLRIQPALGAEFFFFGLDNLGFSAEWGLNLDLNLSADATQTTLLSTPSGGPAVGMHYYF